MKYNILIRKAIIVIFISLICFCDISFAETRDNEVNKNIKVYQEMISVLERDKKVLEDKFIDLKKSNQMLEDNLLAKEMEADLLKAKLDRIEKKSSVDIMEFAEGVQDSDFKFMDIFSILEENDKRLTKIRDMEKLSDIGPVEKLDDIQSRAYGLIVKNGLKDIEISVLGDRIRDVSMIGNEIIAMDIDASPIYVNGKSIEPKLAQELKHPEKEIIYTVSGKEAELAQALKDREQKLKELNDNYNKLIDRSLESENKLVTLSDDYNKLREEYFSAKADKDNVFEVLEDYLYVRRNELNEVKDKLVYKEIDIAKNQDILLSRLDELSKVYESVQDYIDKIDNKDSVIDQKNSELINIREEINKMRESLK